MRLFRFVRAHGGHANDGDVLRLTLRLPDLPAGLAIVEALGVRRLPKHQHLGPSPIKGLEPDEQPGWSEIDGIPAFLWLHTWRHTAPTLDFTLHDPDDLYRVSEVAVRHAERLEPRLEPWAEQRIDPPEDSWHCIAPATYPHWF